MSKADAQDQDTGAAQVCARHMSIGWCALLLFLTLGLTLEFMHGFKVGLYLDVSNEARRLMWTLAHAHGALLSVVNIVFGISAKHMPAWPEAGRNLASKCHLGALVLLPLGFFAGGVFIHGGHTGLCVLLLPPGAVLLFVAVGLTARGALAQSRAS